MLAFSHIVRSALKNNRNFSTNYNTKTKEAIAGRVWTKLQIQNKKDLLRLRVQDLTMDLLEDVLDFNMNYFVKEEIFHKISGISEDPEAVKEYKEIISQVIMKPNYSTKVYIIDDYSNPNTGKIVAVSMMKIVSSHEDLNYNIQTKTEAVRRLLNIKSTCYKLFSIEDVKKMYNVDRYYEDTGLAIHPEYRSLGIINFENTLRRVTCREDNIRLIGAWVTMLTAQKAYQNNNYNTAFDISYKKLVSILGINFEGVPTMCKYMTLKLN
ncbi:uncharacterized protein LOC116412993 [Galleria mellonella]|uniref:Uncharacterized protein LOC116412993 n=1 Tax=Galleria mellonella TaxID=7137 RepID=A0A6J3C347_GALME|nr:uncharacterized protein LOC116412993 [Galleria mellonella]